MVASNTNGLTLKVMEYPPHLKLTSQVRRPSASLSLMSRLVTSSTATGELVAALVHNVREVGADGNYLDGPIPIGEIDEKILLGSLRLIKQERKSKSIMLTKLGLYVTGCAILLPGSDGDMPQIDTEDLIRRLS